MLVCAWVLICLWIYALLDVYSFEYFWIGIQRGKHDASKYYLFTNCAKTQIIHINIHKKKLGPCFYVCTLSFDDSHINCFPTIFCISFFVSCCRLRTHYHWLMWILVSIILNHLQDTRREPWWFLLSVYFMFPSFSSARCAHLYLGFLLYCSN